MSITSFAGKFVRVVRERPSHVFSMARERALFRLTKALWPLLGSKGTLLGKNVRIQRLRCVMAEAPDARIVIGDHSIVYEEARIEAFGRATVNIGECSILGPARMYSRYGVTIGKRFLSSWNVFIQDFDPHPLTPAERSKQVMAMVANYHPAYDTPPPHEKWSGDFRGEPIVIGDDVWVGANVSIFKGARIGAGCIVAAGAVVLRGEYAPNSIIAGNPAKVVKAIA